MIYSGGAVADKAVNDYFDVIGYNFDDSGIKVTKIKNPYDPTSEVIVVVGTDEAIVSMSSDFLKMRNFIKQYPNLIQKSLPKKVIIQSLKLSTEKRKAKAELTQIKQAKTDAVNKLRDYIVAMNIGSRDKVSTQSDQEIIQLIKIWLSNNDQANHPKEDYIIILRQTVAVREIENQALGKQYVIARISEKIFSLTMNTLKRNKDHIFYGNLISFLHLNPIFVGSKHHNSSFFDANNQVLFISLDQVNLIKNRGFQGNNIRGVLEDHPHLVLEYVLTHELSHSFLSDDDGSIRSTILSDGGGSVRSTDGNYIDLVDFGNNRGDIAKSLSESTADVSSLLLMATSSRYTQSEIETLADSLMEWRNSYKDSGVLHQTAPSIKKAKAILRMIMSDESNYKDTRVRIPSIAEGIIKELLVPEEFKNLKPYYSDQI